MPLKARHSVLPKLQQKRVNRRPGKLLQSFAGSTDIVDSREAFLRICEWGRPTLFSMVRAR